MAFGWVGPDKWMHKIACDLDEKLLVGKLSSPVPIGSLMDILLSIILRLDSTQHIVYTNYMNSQLCQGRTHEYTFGHCKGRL